MTVYRDDGSNLSNLSEHEKLLLLRMFEQLPNLKPRPQKPINQLLPGLGSGILQFIPSQQQLSTELADGGPVRQYRQPQLAPEAGATAGDRLLRLEHELAALGLPFAPVEVVQALLADLLSAQLEPGADALSVAVRGLLGGPVRELLAGDTFGERAMEGAAVRTASVVALDVCHFVTLGAEEYNAFVKTRVKAARDEKHQLLVEKFPGYSRLPSEELWKFQYLFQTKTAKAGRCLISELAVNNRAILLKRGQAAVYKHPSTVELLLDWFNSLDYASKNNVELLELVDRAIKMFGAIPEKQPVLVGYVDKPELLGTEVLFSAKHRSLFTVKVVSSELEYYEVGPAVETHLSVHGTKPQLLAALLAVLRYRLEFIHKRLYVCGLAAPPGSRSAYLRLTANPRLRKELQQAPGPADTQPPNAEPDTDRRAQATAVARRFSSVPETRLLQLLRQPRPARAAHPGPLELQEKTAVFSSADMLRFIQKEAKRDTALAAHLAKIARPPALRPARAQPRALSDSADPARLALSLQSSWSHLQRELSPHIRRFYQKRSEVAVGSAQLLVTYAARVPVRRARKAGYVEQQKQVREFNRSFITAGQKPPRGRSDYRSQDL